MVYHLVAQQLSVRNGRLRMLRQVVDDYLIHQRYLDGCHEAAIN